MENNIKNNSLTVICFTNNLNYVVIIFIYFSVYSCLIDTEM